MSKFSKKKVEVLNTHPIEIDDLEESDQDLSKSGSLFSAILKSLVDKNSNSSKRDLEELDDLTPLSQRMFQNIDIIVAGIIDLTQKFESKTTKVEHESKDTLDQEIREILKEYYLKIQTDEKGSEVSEHHFTNCFATNPQIADIFSDQIYKKLVKIHPEFPSEKKQQIQKYLELFNHQKIYNQNISDIPVEEEGSHRDSIRGELKQSSSYQQFKKEILDRNEHKLESRGLWSRQDESINLLQNPEDKESLLQETCGEALQKPNERLSYQGFRDSSQNSEGNKDNPASVKLVAHFQRIKALNNKSEDSDKFPSPKEENKKVEVDTRKSAIPTGTEAHQIGKRFGKGQASIPECKNQLNLREVQKEPIKKKSHKSNFKLEDKKHEDIYQLLEDLSSQHDKLVTHFTPSKDGSIKDHQDIVKKDDTINDSNLGSSQEIPINNIVIAQERYNSLKNQKKLNKSAKKKEKSRQFNFIICDGKVSPPKRTSYDRKKLFKLSSSSPIRKGYKIPSNLPNSTQISTEANKQTKNIQKFKTKIAKLEARDKVLRKKQDTYTASKKQAKVKRKHLSNIDKDMRYIIKSLEKNLIGDQEMNSIFSTGLQLKDRLIDPMKAQQFMQDGRMDRIIDAIPTPRHKKAVESSILQDPNERRQLIRLSKKFTKEITNSYQRKMSEAKRAYLRGPRIVSKLKSKSNPAKQRTIFDIKDRNAQTACYKTRMTVNKFKNSPPKVECKSKECYQNTKYGPAFRSNSYSIRRPKTKQREARKLTLNATFLPYYENKGADCYTNDDLVKTQFHSTNKFSHNKTLKEWKAHQNKKTSHSQMKNPVTHSLDANCDRMHLPSFQISEGYPAKSHKIDRLFNYYIHNSEEATKKLTGNGQKYYAIGEGNNQSYMYDCSPGSTSHQKDSSSPHPPARVDSFQKSPKNLKQSVNNQLKNNVNTGKLESTYIKALKSLSNSKPQTDKKAQNLIDWAESEIYKNICTDSLTDFNNEGDQTFFSEEELSQVIDLAQEEGIQDEAMVKPFFYKSAMTVMKLIQYCGLGNTRYYDSVMDHYKDKNIENTLKLLIRAKQLCAIKNILIKLLKAIHRREEISSKITAILKCNDEEKVDLNIKRLITSESTFLFKLTHNILKWIKELSQESKLFEKIPFVFNNTVYDKHVKNEVIAIKRIISLK
ncbi:unnamed protein product [Moneuplotes crassus]|uniref:Uncharacterized protein n=1 Tax=Euplotes crassus TaxID=5936 RepID=A0AAD1XBX3_EUPCR|nr:unnamed protein product [Moneuplotes crassus]